MNQEFNVLVNECKLPNHNILSTHDRNKLITTRKVTSHRINSKIDI